MTYLPHNGLGLISAANGDDGRYYDIEETPSNDVCASFFGPMWAVGINGGVPLCETPNGSARTLTTLASSQIVDMLECFS